MAAIWFSSIARRMRSLLTFVAMTIVVVVVLLFAFWGYDVWNDRKHTLTVLTATPVFVGSGGEDCGGTKLTVVQPETELEVKRIRYWKNCATVNVELPDSRKGYIVPGIGDVSIYPPLP